MSREPFDAIVSTHGPTVLRVCRAVLGPHAADDAWSETFLAALRAYPRLRPDSDVAAWLVTIAHRKAIDHVRAEQRRARPVDPLDLEIPGDGPADAADHDDVWAAMRALPFKQRATVAYHHVMGLPYAEVASIVGGSEAAARRAAADGIAALRRTLDVPPGTASSPARSARLATKEDAR